MKFRHFLGNRVKLPVDSTRLGPFQPTPLFGVDRSHAPQVCGVINKDIFAQAFFGRFALVRGRGKESIDVRRGAGVVVQEPRSLVDLRRPRKLFILGNELSPHFPAAKLKTVSDLKLYLVQEAKGRGSTHSLFSRSYT